MLINRSLYVFVILKHLSSILNLSGLKHSLLLTVIALSIEKNDAELKKLDQTFRFKVQISKACPFVLYIYIYTHTYLYKYTYIYI